MATVRIVDLSHTVDEHTTVYPGDPQISFAPAATIAEDGFNVLHVHLGSQSGTHVDAPFHFLDDGARIDELDLEMFLGRAVVVDASTAGPREEIGWEHFEPVIDRLGPGVLVLLHTGWDRHWHSERYFEHPYLAVDAAERLIATGVRTVGIDALSIDETVLGGAHPTGFATHHVLLGAGGVVIENLTRLAELDWPDPFVSVLPLKLGAADGAPVRAVAFELAAP
jgi:kynurenine formamidase